MCHSNSLFDGFNSVSGRASCSRMADQIVSMQNCRKNQTRSFGVVVAKQPCVW